MNTVKSTAVVASEMRKAEHDVLHLSTALCPRDRDNILDKVRRRLDRNQGYPENWTLIATSLMEAGVDVSFRTCFRERFATTSLIQIGGRGNRNFEWAEGAIINDFILDPLHGLTNHPDARLPADVLEALFEEELLDGEVDPARLVTLAMRRELRRRGALLTDHLTKAEQSGNYPDVASLGRLIGAQARLVVVDPSLRDRIADRQRLSSRELLAGSVQIWANKLDYFGLELLPGRQEIYWWPHAYDAEFLGYMAGALRIRDFVTTGVAIY